MRTLSPPLLLLRRVAALARSGAAVLAALLIAFEEWGWEPLTRAMARLARLRWIARIEQHIAALPPYAALALMLLPWMLLLPLKFFALWMIGSGQLLLGAAVIAAAKVAGTAVVARMFTLAKPALLQLPWFAHGYGRWSAWKNALLLRLHASAVWAWGRALRFDLRCTWNDWRTAWGA